MEKRVAIIGAGISGLLACKYTLSKGFNPILFEAQDQVGGLWTNTFECTRLQSVRDIYQFSDFPWPDSVQDMFPLNTQLLDYLQSYAQHFQLLPCIKFSSQVISIDYEGESEEEMQDWGMWGGVGKAFGSKGKWNLKVHHTKEDSTKEYVVEFVILCIGRFSGLPDIPEFGPGYGPEAFSGKVLHSVEYAAMDNESAAEFVKGKRIAVIGSGKSAIDIAFECAQANGYKGDRKLSNLFASPTFQNYVAGSPNSIIPLYRQMILPRVPQLVVMGYSESLSNLYTFEMRCQWLSYFLDHTFDLPSIKDMENDVKKWEKHMKRYSGNGKFRRSCIGSVQIWYYDQLCKDIGCNPRRKKGFFSNLFQPHYLADYKGLAPGS